MSYFKDKIILERLYLEEGQSTPQIASLFHINQKTVWYWLRKHQIPIRNRRDAQIGRKHLQYNNSGWFKKENTPSNKRFALSKEELSQLYWTEKLSTSKIAQKLNFTKKTIQQWFKKYNIPLRHFSPSEARRCAKPRVSWTKPEMKFMRICSIHNLPFKYVGNRKFWIENVNPDFVDANGKKIAVEIFGNYWHSPLFNHTIHDVQTIEGRTRVLTKQGWKLIVFWDSELMNRKGEENVLRKLQPYL